MASSDNTPKPSSFWNNNYDYLMGRARPAHMGSQSEAPGKEDMNLNDNGPWGYLIHGTKDPL